MQTNYLFAILAEGLSRWTSSVCRRLCVYLCRQCSGIYFRYSYVLYTTWFYIHWSYWVMVYSICVPGSWLRTRNYVLNCRCVVFISVAMIRFISIAIAPRWIVHDRSEDKSIPVQVIGLVPSGTHVQTRMRTWYPHPRCQQFSWTKIWEFL